jgi:hypothetical protein
MTVYVLQFEAADPEWSIPTDGLGVRYPYLAVPMDAVGTQSHSVQSKRGHITAKISGILRTTWALDASDLRKAIFHVARKHITDKLRHGGNVEPDETIRLTAFTQPEQCPFDAQFMEEPPGSAVQVEVNRPIGFVTNVYADA